MGIRTATTMKHKIKFTVRAFLAVGTLISLLFVPWILVRLWLTPLPHTVQEQLDQAINFGVDGIIVYINRKNTAPQFYAAGWHNRARKIPADPHALFRIASINKLYIAVAITKLISDNRLSLNATVADYFPEYSNKIENAERITIKMLVNHHSGIPNYTDSPNFWVSPPKNPGEALALILGKPANFSPGEKFEYSNTNYLLLGELIEKTTGKPKFHFIRDRILTPLNLNNTYGSYSQVDGNRIMSGYYVGILEDLKTANYGTSGTAMVASAEDVGLFLRALNDGSVFERGEQSIYSSLYYYEHTGLIPGYQSIARFHPEIDTVVVQFVNTTNFDGYDWSLSEMFYSRTVNILKRSQ